MQRMWKISMKYRNTAVYVNSFRIEYIPQVSYKVRDKSITHSIFVFSIWL